MIMKQLIKDLRAFGYTLEFDELLKGWVIIEEAPILKGFLPSSFSEIVFRHGFIFSCGITLDSERLYVKFRRP